MLRAGAKSWTLDDLRPSSDGIDALFNLGRRAFVFSPQDEDQKYFAYLIDPQPEGANLSYLAVPTTSRRLRSLYFGEVRLEQFFLESTEAKLIDVTPESLLVTNLKPGRIAWHLLPRRAEYWRSSRAASV